MKMTDLYSIKDLGDYKVFLPPEGWRETPEARERRRFRAEANRAAGNDPDAKMPEMPVTGSFIYAHPPNYKGAEAFRYSPADWRRKLSQLKVLGIDTVIFQASLWNELKECYYPSEYFRDFKTWNVLEPALEAAAELGLDFYLGGYGSVTCWRRKLETGTIRQETERQMACYRELMRYRRLFKGFYFAPESAYAGERNPELEKGLSCLYERIFSEIRSIDPSLKIMMSPATIYYPGRMGDMAASWSNVFSGAHPDILAPQDSIGCGCITMPHQVEALKIWHEITERFGMEHWSNVECFECCAPYNDENSRRAAGPERVLRQMANAEPFVKKLITWELLYYADPELHPAGKDFVAGVFGKYLNSDGRI